MSDLSRWAQGKMVRKVGLTFGNTENASAGATCFWITQGPFSCWQEVLHEPSCWLCLMKWSVLISKIQAVSCTSPSAVLSHLTKCLASGPDNESVIVSTPPQHHGQLPLVTWLVLEVSFPSYVAAAWTLTWYNPIFSCCCVAEASVGSSWSWATWEIILSREIHRHAQTPVGLLTGLKIME